MNITVLLIAIVIFAWSADRLRLVHAFQHPLRALGWLIIATFAARLMGDAWSGMHAFGWSMGIHFNLALWALAGLGIDRRRKSHGTCMSGAFTPFDSDKPDKG